MATRRRLLSFLTRAELLQLAADYEHSGLTSKPKDEIIDTIVQYAQPSKPDVLGYFSRAQLKSACEELGLDTSGREKQVLIDRLLGREDNDGEEDASDAEKPRGARPRPGELPIDDYRHEDVTRKNIPPAKLASEGTIPKAAPVQYAYNPRRPPVLRFDTTGVADEYFELLDQATLRRLTEQEAQTLRAALSAHEPWLEWAGKQEADKRGTFNVDPVALHIHERVSAQAILKIAARQDVERTLFGDSEQAYRDAVQFYRHEMDWTNRLILGDSLQVMASLASREDLAGRVQSIFIDPPYGVRFASNFQSQIREREVKEKEQDLTREAEMVRAYRDTWHLGIHSYAEYLRARLVVARQLLADSGSLFVQISDENLHRVRVLLDEVFGPDNFCSLISFQKTGSMATTLLATTVDYLLWYAKDISRVKYRQLYVTRDPGDTSLDRYDLIVDPSGMIRRPTPEEFASGDSLDGRAQLTSLLSTGASNSDQTFHFRDHVYQPPSNSHWKTSVGGLIRLGRAERIQQAGERLRYLRFVRDFPVIPLSDRWESVQLGRQALYVVQTAPQVVERCVLMTTDPGDLVLDPTCGSGTTAAVAEEWGRRWITVDTSRVALAIARQRLMTATFDYFALRDGEKGPSSGFEYETIAHVTLKSIAQNVNLDPIFDKHEPVMRERLISCNEALTTVTEDLRRRLAEKLLEKQKSHGKRAISEADQRRWALPKAGIKWNHWQVPFDVDKDWPRGLRDAVAAYRQAWRAKMDEVNACIEANADQEDLVDRPRVVKGILRVSGPFTVEAVQPAEESLGLIQETSDEFGGAPPDLGERFSMGQVESAVQNVQAYLAQMIRLLRTDGVRFPNNRQMQFTRLDGLSDASGLHAEGRWVEKGGTDDDPEGRATVAVAFGPQYGPVTAPQVAAVIRAANRRGYDNLVIAGFSFDGAAQADIEESQHPKLHIDMAHIRPDVNPGMEGLLKEQPNSQLFSVFGQPRSHVSKLKDGTFTVTMEGVDIYDPVSNTLSQSGATKIAAWFLDGDYDGATFCITQAFFPNRDAWEKISRALKTSDAVDESVFDRLAGTISLPFPAGKHRRAAVKVIDPRGNEVMQVHRLE
jgi:adenine-specific DNA-methyltransferase